MVRGIANSKIGFGDLILLLRYFFKLKVSTHPRFYEKEGLIPEPERTEGNYRLYDIGYVERIKFILNCRTLNMSLNEIRQLLTYKDNPKKNCSDVNELIDLHVSAIRENIIKQQKLIEQLSDLRGTCDGLCTIDQCGVLKNLA